MYLDRRSDRGLMQSIDWILVACYFVLVLTGILNIYASIHSTDTSGFFDLSSRSGKQLMWWGISLFASIFIIFIIPYRIYESFSPIIYILSTILLVSVIFLGKEVNGSHSWFALGPFSFQPAEVSKIATSLFLAAFMSQTDYRMRKVKDFILTILIILLPMVLIVGSKETGSALVYMGFVFVLYREGLSGWLLGLAGVLIALFLITLSVSSYAAILIASIVISIILLIFAGKAKWVLYAVLPISTFLGFLPKILEKFSKPENWGIYLLIGLIAIGAIVLLYLAFRKRRNYLVMGVGALVASCLIVFSTEFLFYSVLKEHQRRRIEVILGLTEDPNGVGYNVNQSMIAIGSGGFAGKGYLEGTQTTFGFVPEQSTDFIFCTIGEEWGFLGSSLLIIVYIVMIGRILNDAEKSREKFTRIYGYCCASCIFVHLFVNIGMTIGIMPVIGIPLPFISYGGSSLLAFSIMLAIFIALYKQEKKYF